ncbi:MAG: chorismate synthase [Deltaproteobacteria bacterium]|nr:chorismate synthase [Deltaproteobacteria bacterium]
MLRYLTGGESHGRILTAVIDGMPAGIGVSPSHINRELKRRQAGYGRGGRQRIEEDRVDITSGVRFGKTLGSPITLQIPNLDWENWKEKMAAGKGSAAAVTRPRPGHADLAGALKYFSRDIRDILERSSARETAARVAVGAAAKRMLALFGIRVLSWVVGIGGVSYRAGAGERPEELFSRAEGSVLRCPGKTATSKMKKIIDLARNRGDSVGGVFEVAVTGVPPGLGSHAQWDRKLDGRLAMALMGIQAIKAVEVGMGFEASSTPGSGVHDEIFYGYSGKGCSYWPLERRFFRKTNNAGGIEGGMSNGEPILLRAAMKPIPTLYKPLRSADLLTKRPFSASVERSDVCAVPAASVVGEAVVAFEIASSFLEKFGGDSIREVRRNYRGYLKQIKSF